MNFSQLLKPHTLFSPPNAPSWRLSPFPGGEDTYGESYRYDEVWSWDASALEAMNEICREAGGTLLDLGGGTGGLAESLVRRGHKVTLVDRSKRMLTRAREKRARLSSEERARFHIEQADLRTLERSETYPCIFAIGCPATFLSDRTEILDFLRKVYGWLEPGGHFYMDFFSLRYWEAFPGWKSGKWQYWLDRQTSTGKLRAWVKTYPDVTADRFVFEYSMGTRLWPFRFFHSAERVCLFPEATWRELLTEAGFTVLEQFGDWARPSAPIGTDINLITLKSQK